MKLFDWLRGKRKLGDVAIEDLAESTATMLLVQVTVAGGHTSDLATRRGSKALGYVYGTVDAALRTVGQDMAEMSVGVPALYQVLRRLFPGSEDRYLDFITQSVTSDRDMMSGMMKGGQQYIDWRNGKINTPMGLARYLLELRKGAEETGQEA